MNIAAVFPGQGSQKPGMGKELYEMRSDARDVFARVTEATGVDVVKLCFDTEEEVLRQTENAQIALYTVSVSAFKCLKTHIGTQARISAFAGHSVGEYAAVASAGIITIEDGAKLVRKRGELMAEAGKNHPGGMAAILGLDREALETALGKVPGIVVVANDNCPGQLVISGESDAIKLACEAATAAGAKRAIPLNVSGAFHSPLMQGASTELGAFMNTIAFSDPSYEGLGVGPVYSNVTSEAVGRISDLPGLLQKGLTRPVRWTETIENLGRDEIDVFVEFGCGEVLSGLIKRTIKNCRCIKVQDLESLEEAIVLLRR